MRHLPIIILLFLLPITVHANLGVIEKKVANICLDYLKSKDIGSHSLGSSEIKVFQSSDEWIVMLRKNSDRHSCSLNPNTNVIQVHTY